MQSYIDILESLAKAFKLAKLENTRILIRSVIMRIFDTVNQRLILQGYIFVSENPMRLFYSTTTKNLIKDESRKVLFNLVDKIELIEANKKGENFFTDFSKNKLKEHKIGFGRNDFYCKKNNKINFEGEIKIKNQESKNKIDFKNEIEIKENELKNKNIIVNEKNQKSGKLGWCFICRSPAEYLCLQKRIPICSIECKLLNKRQEERLKNLIKLNIKDYQKEIYFNENFLLIFDWLIDRSFGEFDKVEKNFFLNILGNLIKTAPKALKNNKKVINFVINDISKKMIYSDNDLKDPVMLKNMLSLFLNLFVNYRVYLKKEIEIFIKNIILTQLEDEKISFKNKFYLIHILKILIEDKFFAFELFLNFDCENGTENICENMVDILVRISQGKYREETYKDIMKNQNILILEKNAIWSLLELIKGTSIFLSRENDKKINDNKNEKIFDFKEMEKFNAIKYFESEKNFKEGFNKLLEINCFVYEPKSFLVFLKKEELINKKLIGKIISDEDEFFENVTLQYIKDFDFKDKTFLNSLYHFFDKIEVTLKSKNLEKIIKIFCEKICKDKNIKDEYKTYFLITYNILLLDINLHNPKITKKINIKEFTKILREKNFYKKEKTDFLIENKIEEIYNIIFKKSLCGFNYKKGRELVEKNILQNLKKKKLIFGQTEINISQKTIILKEIETNYNFLKDAYSIKLFFSTLWTNFHVLFTTILTKGCDSDTLRLIIDSIFSLIKLTNIFHLILEQNSFLELLFKFSGLERTNKNVLHDKNILFIQSLLSVTNELFFEIYDGWRPILDCVISLIYYHNKIELLSSYESSSDYLTKEENNTLKLKNFIQIDNLNEIFSKSRDLPIFTFLQFIESLTDIIYTEIDTRGLRSHYILEQLIDLININLDRNPFELILIWEKIISFYSKLLDSLHHSNLKLFIYSLDILKQLIFLFFENEEIIEYNYQKEVLNIFFVITSHPNINNDILEYIIFLLLNFIKKKHKNINNGFSIYIKVLKDCLIKSRGTNEDTTVEFDIAYLVKEVLDFVFENIEYFIFFLESNMEEFIDVISLLGLKKKIDIVDKSLFFFINIYNMFWHQENILGISLHKNVLLKLSNLVVKSEKNYFISENIFFKILILPNLKKMCSFSQWKNEDQFKKILQKIFKLITKLKDNFDSYTWSILFDELFKKLYNEIHKEYLKMASQDILMYIYKFIFSLCLSSPKREDLIKKIYKILTELTKKKDKLLNDCLILNLGQNVLEIKNLKEDEKKKKIFGK